MTIGQTLKGRYKLLERIGTGGMSTVYLARVLDTGQTVAVKVVNDTLAFDEQYIHRFSQELAIARLLTHPGIPRLIDDGETEEGVPFIVMEYVQGITLTEYIKKKGPLPIEEAVAMTEQVLSILSYAYSKGIQAHRDIKPGNIMIDLRTHAVTVMDFGIAKTVGSSLTHSTVLYTPKYAAPEQLLPSKFGGVVDKRADLYAVGVVLYEMLTGRAPFNGETPAEISGEQITSAPPSPSVIRTDIPAPLSQVLLKCLQPNPSHRYQTPQELLQDLKAGHVRETGQPRPQGRETNETVIKKALTPNQQTPRPRVPLLIPLVALALVILIPLTIVLVRRAKPAPTAVVPPTQVASLSITSTPSGAEVSLDGITLGTTPITNVGLVVRNQRLTLKDGTFIGTTRIKDGAVALGTHTLRLTLSGYNDYATTVTLQAGDLNTVTAPLTKIPVTPTTATLTVTSTPSGAKVFLDGTSIGTTPITNKTVAPGTHTLSLSLGGYDAYRSSVNLLAGNTKTVPITLVKQAVTPTTATLNITSIPSGAQAYLDGTNIGTTPIMKRTVTPGTHTVQLTLAGYDTYETTATLKTGEAKTVPAALTKKAVTPTTATLTVTSTPAGAQVFLDGTGIGVTPVTKKDVSPGTHATRLTLAGYDDYTATVTLQAGDAKNVTATLAKAVVARTTGTLTVTSTPEGAEVFLDGKSLGTTPVTKKDVAPGTRELRLTLAGYNDYPTSVTVQAGDSKTVTATLTFAVVPGVTGNQILIGSFSVQTGPYAVVGVPFSQGMQSYFDMVNDAGGVYGRKINLEVVDDQFNPANTVTVVKKFVTEDKVFAVVGGVGSPGCAAVVDYLNDQKVPFIYQASGLSSLSIPAKQYVFAVQPNYINEGQVIAKYAGSTLGLKNIAVLYSNDQAGNEWLAGTKQGAGKFGSTIVLESPFPATETDFTPYLLKVQASNANALIIYTSSVATAGLAVKTAKSLGLTQKIFLSYVAAGLAGTIGAAAAEGVYIPGWVDFSDVTSPDVVKFFSMWNKYYPNGNQALYSYACAGWVAAEVFTEAVRRAGQYPTRDALVWALETFDGWSGYLAKDISYSPTAHSGKYSLFFMQVQKGALVKVSDWINVLKP